MSKSEKNWPDILVKYLVAEIDDSNSVRIGDDDVSCDVTFVYKLFDLQKIVRFFGQRYWERETKEDLVRPGELLLETVAAHSFQVASSVRWLAPHFPSLDLAKVVDLALLHDQPEILIGDRDPVGSNGSGSDTHAFNSEKRSQKENDERAAADELAAGMRRSMRGTYRALVAEYLDGLTGEAQFVRAVDKLQALAFVRLKKEGCITAEHMAFTIRYSRLGVRSFPQLRLHFQFVLADILKDVSSKLSDQFLTFCHVTSDILEKSDA